MWQSPKVPLQKLNSEHFVKCSDEFVRLVHYHSVYTISNGNITIQINDLRIIERDFVQEFVLGKPIITHVLDIPQVIWKRPVHNTQIIVAVKKNIPQVCTIQNILLYNPSLLASTASSSPVRDSDGSQR